MDILDRYNQNKLISKPKRVKTLKYRLFWIYFLSMLLFLLISFGVSAFFIIRNEYNATQNNLNTIAASIGNNLDLEIDKLSTASMNTVYSKSLKNNMDGIDPENPDWNRISAVNNIIGSIIGASSLVSQINIYSVHDYEVGWGTFSIAAPNVLQNNPWYEPVHALHGSKYVEKPHRNEDFILINPFMKERFYISMYRMYFDSAFMEQGVVEVMQDCASFFSYLNEVLITHPEILVRITDANGDVIFPYVDLEGADTKIESRFHAESVSKNCGWNILVTQGNRAIVSKIVPYILIGTALFFIFLFAFMFICLSVAGYLLKPLNALQTQLKKINLDDIISSDTSFMVESDVHTEEIDTLIDIYNNMYLSLKASSESILAIRTEETRAKLFAAQSIMKPHFLYNNLTNVSVMAENGMNTQIVSYCTQLSKYLRYITTNDPPDADIASEAENSKNYLDCMKLRYQDKLHYKIDIADRAANVRLPKLTIQPIVENSIKYALHNAPPWMIRIEAVCEDDFCYLSVSDNGTGFTQESLHSIRDSLKEVRAQKDVYSMKIGGLGIKNVFLRLLFMYGDATDIVLSGSESAGARVTIIIPMAD